MNLILLPSIQLYLKPILVLAYHHSYTSPNSPALVIATFARIGPTISKNNTENKINVTIPDASEGNSFLTIIDNPMDIPPCGNKAQPKYFTILGSDFVILAPKDVPITFPNILPTTYKTPNIPIFASTPKSRLAPAKAKNKTLIGGTKPFNVVNVLVGCLPKLT